MWWRMGSTLVAEHAVRGIAGILQRKLARLANKQREPTWPTSMAAVFLRLLAGVYTISTLLSLCPSMEFALTNCPAEHSSRQWRGGRHEEHAGGRSRQPG